MKNLIIIVGIAAVVCSTIVHQFESRADPAAIEAEELLYPEIKKEVVAARCFGDTKAAVSKFLERGEISLADAARRVHDAAQLWRPRYLEDIQETEIGQAPLERVARNLVGHMRNRAEFDPGLVGRVQELQAELDRLVGEMEDTRLTSQ